MCRFGTLTQSPFAVTSLCRECHSKYKHFSTYLLGKIDENNMACDNEVDRQLNDLGWTVIRFWGNEIKKHPDFCLKAVEECIMEKKVDGYNVWGFGEDDE